MDAVPPSRSFHVVRTEPGIYLEEAHLNGVKDYADFQAFLVSEIVRHSWQFLQSDPMLVLDGIFEAASRWFERADFVRFLEVFDIWKEHLRDAVREWLVEKDDWSLSMHLEETRSIRPKPVRSAPRWVWEDVD